MLSPLDVVALIALAVAIPLYLHYVDVPRMRKDIASGRPDARRDGYRRTLVQQWACTLLLLAGWQLAGRPFASLLLAWPRGAGAWMALGVALAGLALAYAQSAMVARSPAAQTGVRRQLAPLEWLLPHTPRESAWFRALSVTAGTCEEIVFRGYFTWGLAQFVPPMVAVVGQAAVFGLAHSYQGKGGIIKTGVVGLVLGAIAVGTGSLIAPIAIHAAMDLSAGRIADLLFGAARAGAPGPASEATA